ncbi:hypothetical protein ACOHYD_08965 [Desulfobacterota bacterium M19]
MKCKKETQFQKNMYTPEPGEERLAALIKEAGKDARARKKKAMDYHFKKLRAAVRGTLQSFEQTTTS